MREYRYLVDREGRIFHDGTEVIDGAVLRFFLSAMRRTAEGQYLVMCQKERNWFEAWDTPFVVQRVVPTGDAADGVALELYLAGDYHETLDPNTLESEEGYLYCRVRRGAFRARFGRTAMQHLTPWLADSANGPVLRVGRARYLIRQPQRLGR